MNPSPMLYCTDEILAIRSAGDFALLCPKDQKLAEGSDGTFPMGSPWTLVSGSVDFELAGVGPGQIVQLAKTGVFRGAEDFAIEDVAGGTLQLRRKGLEPGIGQPPGPTAGATGVGFVITTLMPQIRNASLELNRRYGVEDLMIGRTLDAGFDPQEVVEACASLVLWNQYEAMTRHAGDQADQFLHQARNRRAELDARLARLTVLWNPSSPSRASSPFSTHLSR